MSRVGKNQITIPNGVKSIVEGNLLNFEKNGVKESYNVPSCIEVEKTEVGILLKPINQDKRTRSLWGTSQRNVANIVFGLDKGFKIELEMVGVGYKAAVAGRKLTMQLGYSHDINYEIPEGIKIDCPKPTTMSITGHNKKQVGDVAAYLRSFRKPEPYKGKGIIKSGEFVYRKEGKKK
ncbi:MAG: 50S ribosomal protein L6 [Holosporales bacterium]|jgi:large subunit ribosomal protein L6|nr:50S ribosomal protein L6 [Holosporales bacterium]